MSRLNVAGHHKGIEGPRVLLVDDEHAIVRLLQYIFEEAGFTARTAVTGEEALAIVRSWFPDLVILDIGLPGISGLDVCRALHEFSIPVIVVSSHDHDDDVVEGLEKGADDYVTKPFNHRELVLRARKLIERGSRVELLEQQGIIRTTSLVIDIDRGTVNLGSMTVNLTPTETRILRLLSRTPGKPVDIETILIHVWKHPDRLGGPEMVKVNIRRLRHKIEPDPRNPRYIMNRRGLGYYLAP